MASFGMKRVQVDRLPTMPQGTDGPEYRAALYRTREMIRDAIPDGYDLLSIEEHIVSTTEQVARHTSLELAGDFKRTDKERRFAILTLTRKGMRRGT